MQPKRPLAPGDIIIPRGGTKPAIIIDIVFSPFESQILCYVEELNEIGACTEYDVQYRLGTTLGSKMIPGMPVFHTKLNQIMHIASCANKVRPQSYNINGKIKTRPYQTEKTYLVRNPHNPILKLCTASEHVLIPLRVPSKIRDKWIQARVVKDPLHMIFHSIKKRKQYGD